jgi:5'-nucleotidase
MIILLTNDDGVYAEGLQALRQEMEQLDMTEIYVVAPDRERSATGHAITMHRPLFAEEVRFSGARSRCYSVTGTPADCTKLAIEALLGVRPDLVISGINRGANLGTDVFYSGTVSAAIESTILGIPSIAVSLAAWRHPDFTPAARFARQLARKTLEEGLPRGTLLNVNVPPLDPSLCAGVVVTKLGVRLYKDVFDRRTDPRGREYYWLAGELMEYGNDPDTDVAVVSNNQISVTPIHLDLTNHNLREVIQKWSLGAT